MLSNSSNQCGSSYRQPLRQFVRELAFLVVVGGLGGCGGGGGGDGTTAFQRALNNPNSGDTIVPDDTDTEVNSGEWVPGVFLNANTFEAMCEVPVVGSGDVQGTTTDENNFLRSYSNDTYLWYDEIVDMDPALFSTPDYFELLKTDDLTPSGNFKDNFHFTIPTDEFNALSQSGISVGYGAQFALLQSSPPRNIVVAYTDPSTPATAVGVDLARGAEILTIDGVDVVNGSDVDTLNEGLFPDTDGESHTFTVRDLDSTVRMVTMQAAVITSTPVQNVKTIATASGAVGYLQFNDHIATAEGGLFNAVTQLAGLGITDLIIDVRYNGGGFLDIASEFSYMIAGAARTAGQTFEEITFNDKHPDTNPISGEALIPTPFHNRSLGFDPSLAEGTVLPTLDLTRVYVLTGSDTCSASEAIINGLRGVDVEVIQIGSTTCGKPFGFFPANNCGTTYFTIQFQGINAKGFGEYPDGFSPANTVSDIGTVVPGCSVGDDFTAALGDPAEERLAAALNHRVTDTCPAASGVSPTSLSKVGLLPSDKMIVPKSLWLQNRIMRP
ncbi:MAG: carboxyl-terminal processing protease [Gammaproteobacteria bacterium]|jgi:carboxyl-terminal processing protease